MPPIPDAFGTIGDWPTLGVLLAVAFSASLARGFSGFGAALIFIPLASAMLGPKLAVPVLLIVDGIMTAGMIPAAARAADRREVATMALGALAGVPAGIWGLATLDPLTLRWAISVVAFGMLALLLSGWRYHGRPRAAVTVLVGTLSGVFSGAAQIGGPPVVAYWLGGAGAKAVVRGNIILFFAVSSIITATGYFWSGLFTTRMVLLALVLAPAYGLGAWLGSSMFWLASEKTFRWICLAMIFAATLASLPALDGFLRGA